VKISYPLATVVEIFLHGTAVGAAFGHDESDGMRLRRGRRECRIALTASYVVAGNPIDSNGREYERDHREDARQRGNQLIVTDETRDLSPDGVDSEHGQVQINSSDRGG
jgi:hypothetical protein